MSTAQSTIIDRATWSDRYKSLITHKRVDELKCTYLTLDDQALETTTTVAKVQSERKNQKRSKASSRNRFLTALQRFQINVTMVREMENDSAQDKMQETKLYILGMISCSTVVR